MTVDYATLMMNLSRNRSYNNTGIGATTDDSRKYTEIIDNSHLADESTTDPRTHRVMTDYIKNAHKSAENHEQVKKQKSHEIN